MDISLIYGHLTELWTYGDTDVRAGERCMTSGAGPGALQGRSGWVIQLGRDGVWYYLVCARRCTRLVLSPTHAYSSHMPQYLASLKPEYA